MVDGKCEQCAGRDLWQAPGSFRDRNVPDFSAVDPNLRPMAQSKATIGISLRFRPLGTLSAQYVHNHLNRAVEDIASLVDGKEALVYGNPGEGAAGTMFGRGENSPVCAPKISQGEDRPLLGGTSHSAQ